MDTHKRHRCADCIELPRDLLRMVLQFAIGDLRTRHMLLQVSKQFMECVLDPASLTHVKVVMRQHFDRSRSVPGLRTLRLISNSVDGDMVELQRDPPVSLQTLDLSHRPCWDPDDRAWLGYSRGGIITNEGLTTVGGIRTLTAVDLTNCVDISDVGILALNPLAGTLQTLNLSNCRGITNQAMAWLPRDLRCLYVNECEQITDVGVGQLARQPELRELGVRSCAITDVLSHLLRWCSLNFWTLLAAIR